MFNINEFNQVMKNQDISDDVKTKAYQLLNYRYMFTSPVKTSYVIDPNSLRRSFDRIYANMLNGTLDFVDGFPVRITAK